MKFHRQFATVLALMLFATIGVQAATPITVTFDYTGTTQTWQVPSGVTSITIDAWGAQGNSNGANVVGGLGGYSTGTLAVTPGSTLTIQVGGGGQLSTTGGYNGGGNAGTSIADVQTHGGGGGGASDVRAGGSTLAHRVIVAAGGGGAGGNRVAISGRGNGGGGGGGYYGGGGGAAWPSNGTLPTGATQTSGGVGGVSTYASAPDNNGYPGVLGVGGRGGNEVTSNQADNGTASSGGVGGGATGGDGLYAGNFTGQSGAGGSSYIDGVTNGTTTPGIQLGNGVVKFTYTPLGLTLSQAFAPTSISAGGVSTVTFTIVNINQTDTYTGIAFSNTLPSGLVVATPNGVTGSVGGGTVTAVAGSSSISFSGATLAPGASGSFSVNVTSTLAGDKINTTGAISSTETGAVDTSTATLAVNPGPASTFDVSATTPVIAGNTTSITVTALDQYANLATTYSGAVHFTSTDSLAVLPNDSTLTNGVGSFTATLATAGIQTITATDSGIQTIAPSFSGTSNDITVTPGATTALRVSAPLSAGSGVAFNVTVTAIDAYGNTTPDYAGTVHFTSSDMAAVLPADSTCANGVGTFSATLSTIGDQTITATDTMNASITGTSELIAVAPPITLNSGPSVYPNPSFVDVSNAFSISVSPSNSTIEWDFGDGTTGSGFNPKHIYSASGIYNITVTITDPESGASITRTLSLPVTQLQAETSGTLSATQSMNILYGRIRTVKNQCLQIQGLIPLDTMPVVRAANSRGINFKGVPVKLSVNGLTRSFTLNKQGHSVLTDSRFGIKPTTTNPNVGKFEFYVNQNTLSRNLATDVGLDTTGRPKVVVIVLTFNGQTFSSVIPLNYKPAKDPGYVLFGLPVNKDQ